MALSQSHFRFGIEELLEATHGWWQNEDVNHSQEIAADWAFLLRFCVQADATGLTNVDNEFQYNKNGAGWVNITTTSSVVKAVASVAFTNAQVCTKRLSGTGTFEASGAGCTEDGTSGGTTNDIVASGNSETEAGLAVVFANVVNGDTIQFRLTRDVGILLNSYPVTPTLTISVAAPVLVIPTPIFGIAGIVIPTVILGSLNIIASTLSAIGITIDPLVILGSLGITPTSASAVQGGVDPTVQIETPGVTVTPDPIFALGSKVDPLVILGSLILTPSGLDAIGGKVDPVVILGSVVVIPSTIDVLGGTANPNVVLGSIILTPANVWVIGSKGDPTVDIGGGAIVPVAVFAVGNVVSPTIWLGSTIAIPSPIAVISDRASPTVVMGSLIIENPIVSAGSGTKQFTYQIARKIHRKYARI